MGYGVNSTGRKSSCREPRRITAWGQRENKFQGVQTSETGDSASVINLPERRMIRRGFLIPATFLLMQKSAIGFLLVLGVISPSTPDARPEYLTTREVAELTKYKKATLEALRAKRQGPPFYRQGFNIRY
ncbi:helix-turn-helix domain-containing protein [Pelagivirga sediminicola]|uniref:helix-turn-helix domain-containing protein n=1 Tax=Pelagivirga sediminicola TaxID=2170575 RepID=UPI0014042313|nr:helix-turn-helix domain-containing protein [Pelagivirga sediminicola]